MSQDELRRLLSVLPEESEIAGRAARARRTALARLEQTPGRGLPRLRWAAALACAAALLVAAVFVESRREPAPAARAQMAGRQRVQKMYWVLSDGTRVLWTFHNDRKM